MLVPFLVPLPAALPTAIDVYAAFFSGEAAVHAGWVIAVLMYSAIILAVVAMVVLSNIKGRFIALTATGVEYRMLLHHRIVPWSRIQRARVMPGLTPSGVVVLELTNGTKRGIVAVVTPERAGEVADCIRQRIEDVPK
jgi:hypothetical protein